GLPGPTTTTVTCTALDVNGNSKSASFTVNVQDTTPPAVIAPAAISVAATEIGGARGNVAGSAGSQTLAGFLSGATAIDMRDPAPAGLSNTAIINGTAT